MQFEPLPPVPTVTLAQRLRRIPLFRFASVDELFRVSVISQQVRYDAGAPVQRRGAKAEYIQVLLEGAFELADGNGHSETLTPPAMLGFQEVLEGTTLSNDARASMESIALVMPAEELRTLLSANIELAQGLFRMLLEQDRGETPPSPIRTAGTFDQLQTPALTQPLKAVDKALFLQTLPLLVRATAEELYAVATITREITYDAGETIFSEGDPSSIVLVLSGALELQSPDGASSSRASAGQCLGMEETLAGSDWRWRAVATEPGKALRIDREHLFEVLSDQIELLQGIFGAIFFERDSPTKTTAKK